VPGTDLMSARDEETKRERHRSMEKKMINHTDRIINRDSNNIVMDGGIVGWKGAKRVQKRRNERRKERETENENPLSLSSQSCLLVDHEAKGGGGLLLVFLLLSLLLVLLLLLILIFVSLL